jgi:hypothetical protein
MAIEWRKRHTIMDGEVVTFATDFSQTKGVFGPIDKAEGPFEVSASRNAVLVHHAELCSDTDVAQFLEAVQAAKHAALRLTFEGIGGNYARTSGEN